MGLTSGPNVTARRCFAWLKYARRLFAVVSAHIAPPFFGGSFRCDVSSSIDCDDGNWGGGLVAGVCVKCGIVEIRGDSAHGLVSEVRSCSSVGSMKLRDNQGMKCGEAEGTDCMNLRAAPAPHGSFRGRSKVFPNRMSSAECGCRNLPELLHCQSRR